MREVRVDTVAEADLEEPVLVEGLPGVGQVGKLAVDHLIDELGGTVIRRVVSEYFTPQVTVTDDAIVELAGVRFHAIHDDACDLLVLAGDYQANGIRGHYRVAERFLDVASELDAVEIITLGGVPTGTTPDGTRVIGAVNGDHQARFEQVGVVFDSGEPTGGIVGTSGLLLGLGERRGIPAACLMGETSGYLVDPGSAKAVLETLERVLGIAVDFTALEERAARLEAFLERFQERSSLAAQPPGDEDLRYFR